MQRDCRLGAGFSSWVGAVDRSAKETGGRGGGYGIWQLYGDLRRQPPDWPQRHLRNRETNITNASGTGWMRYNTGTFLANVTILGSSEP